MTSNFPGSPEYIAPENTTCCPPLNPPFSVPSEEDHPIPGWWTVVFLATILFSGPYWIYYHGGTPGRTLQDSYDRSLAANMQLQFAEIGELTANGDNILKFMGKPSWVTFGKTIFKTNCASCHGNEGGGLIGPNLCDDYYKNIKTLDDFVAVMENGANNGAMPAWKNKLGTHEIVMVSAYVASLRGSEPSNPKPPLGSVIAPWPEIPPP